MYKYLNENLWSMSNGKRAELNIGCLRTDLIVKNYDKICKIQREDKNLFSNKRQN